MAMEIAVGQAITLAEAAGWFERRFGRRPNVATVWRWSTKGVKGVRLATISLGRYRYTTPHALESFIAETSNAGVSSVTGGGDRPQDSDAVASPAPFTRGDVVAATRRRQEEKERAKQYLRSQLGSRSARGASRRAASG
jgi:hypothetical protein